MLGAEQIASQVTTREAMAIAMQAAGAARTEVESQLSKVSLQELLFLEDQER